MKLSPIKMNKRGQFTDLFVFMIIAVIVLFISGLFIYMGLTVDEQLDESFKAIDETRPINYTETKDATFGYVNIAYSSLYWISIMLIVGMIIAIFTGNYMVTTRPIFFVPYIFVVIIAVLVSVGISNAYQTVAESDVLAETFAGFIGSNYIMYYLPVWITVIGFVGGIIMFVRMKQAEDGGGYGYQ